MTAQLKSLPAQERAADMQRAAEPEPLRRAANACIRPGTNGHWLA